MSIFDSFMELMSRTVSKNVMRMCSSGYING